jgi:hypothetical protein
MSYEMEEIRQSQEIFYYLLKNHKLTEQGNELYYKLYTENEKVQILVKQQAVAAESTVEGYGSVIYLIPDSDNNYLGYSKAMLKARLCKSGGTDKDYYLAQFTILTILMMFYDGQGVTSKTRDYIRVGELQNEVAESLKNGVQRYDENQQELVGIAYGDMQSAYEALKSVAGSRAKTTKEGFLAGILIFLQEQGLVEYIESDDMIKTTKKLDNFMDFNLLNRNNFFRIKSIVEDAKLEQD